MNSQALAQNCLLEKLLNPEPDATKTFPYEKQVGLDLYRKDGAGIIGNFQESPISTRTFVQPNLGFDCSRIFNATSQNDFPTISNGIVFAIENNLHELVIKEYVNNDLLDSEGIVDTNIVTVFKVSNPLGPSVLNKKFVLVNTIEVNRFLNEHRQLIPILNEANREICSFFPSASVYLRLSKDYDSVDPFEELVAIIKSNLPAEETLQKFTKFEEEWWYPNMDQTMDLLIIRV